MARTTASLELLLTVDTTPESLAGPINGLAVDEQGNIYIGEGSPGGKVHVYDPQGKVLAAWGDGRGRGEGQFDYITSLATDGQGNVYVADFNNVRIQKFDRAGRFLAEWPTEQPIGPTGVTVDSSGNIYVVNHRKHPHYVQKFDTAGHLLLAWGDNGKGPSEFDAGASSGPEGIAVDAAGRVYVTDPNNARAQEFTADGVFVTAFGSAGYHGEDGTFFPGNGPAGVAADSDGNVYAAGGDGTIEKFDAAGRFVAKWDKTGADRLIALDHRGGMYVTDDKQRSVLKYRQP